MRRIEDNLVQERRIEEISMRDEQGRTLLMASAKDGDLEEVKQILDLGADLYARDHNDATALSFAVENGNNEVLKLLLDYGA